MRRTQELLGQQKTSRTAERDIEHSADQKRNADGVLHLLAGLACPAPRDNWADGRANAARSKQHADAGGGFAGHRKDSLAEDCQQSQDAAANAPRRLYHQVSKYSRAMLDITRAFDCVADAERLA